MSLHFSQAPGLPTANLRSRTQIYLVRVAVFFAVIFSAASLPAEIVIDNGTVTSISGLIVDGTPYDVTFSALSQSFSGFFGDPDSLAFIEPTFWGNSTGASNAVEALAAALNAYNLNNSPTITGVGEPGNLYALVPYSYPSGSNTVQSFLLNRNASSWTNGGSSYESGPPDNDFWIGVWVDFNPPPAPVPEIATLGTWLCFSLAGYGGLRYRRRSANSVTRV